MTAKKTSEFSGKPGKSLGAHDKHRIALAYRHVQNGTGKSTALKRACLQHPTGLKPAKLRIALANLPAAAIQGPKIKLSSHLSADLRVALEAQVDRLRKAFDSNQKYYGETLFVDLHVGDEADHDAKIDDGMTHVP